jgi:phage head maturation protease
MDEVTVSPVTLDEVTISPVIVDEYTVDAEQYAFTIWNIDEVIWGIFSEVIAPSIP